MSRTIVELKNTDSEKNEALIQNILTESDFKKINEKGEDYWVNTEFPAHLCIKYTLNQDKIILEGWVKIFRIASFIKSVYSEKDLDGFEAKISKKACKKVLDQITMMVV